MVKVQKVPVHIPGFQKSTCKYPSEHHKRIPRTSTSTPTKWLLWHARKISLIVNTMFRAKTALRCYYPVRVRLSLAAESVFHWHFFPPVRTDGHGHEPTYILFDFPDFFARPQYKFRHSHHCHAATIIIIIWLADVSPFRPWRRRRGSPVCRPENSQRFRYTASYPCGHRSRKRRRVHQPMDLLEIAFDGPGVLGQNELELEDNGHEIDANSRLHFMSDRQKIIKTNNRSREGGPNDCLTKLK